MELQIKAETGIGPFDNLDRTFKFLTGKPSLVFQRHSFTSLPSTPNVGNTRDPLERKIRKVSPEFERARMAFSFGGNLGAPTQSMDQGKSNGSASQRGPDLEEIQTETLGFRAIAGDAKLRLLPSPWPADSLPPPTASLLSVASTKGLVAAAGPESVSIASSESVRQAFAADLSATDAKPFSPQLTLPIGMRISHVAFSADENFLVLSAEQGGGLAVYDVQSIAQGSTQSAFELSTNGTSLRALTPNPTAERAELFAAVTSTGELMIANLKNRQFLNGLSGKIMRSGVSCVSWSVRGKQLVAGLGDGSAFQMTPEGEGKAEIPRAPDLEGDQHVSSISWLENNVFLIVHTPSAISTEGPLPSTFNLVTRQPPTMFAFQKLPEPCAPFGLNRSPAYQFIHRLRDFPPNIQDIVIIAATTSTDIGMFTRSRIALSSEHSSEAVTNVFTTTGMADDASRAILPMGEDITDTSPIGMAIDLSSKDKVMRPLPAEEIEESPGPLPALMMLNNEGILAAWWIVYSDSIKQGTAYPGLFSAQGASHLQTAPLREESPFASISNPLKPVFGQSAFGTPSNPQSAANGGIFGRKPASLFGSPSAPDRAINAFQGSQLPASSAALASGPPQTGGASFGQPAFGSTSAIGASSQGSAIGSLGGLGNRASPWGPSGSRGTGFTGSAFGQPSRMGLQAGSAFGSGTPLGSTTSSSGPTSGSSSGFASFQNTGGFGAVTAKVSEPNVFGQTTPAASFSSGMDTDTSFGFQREKNNEVSGGFLGAASGFSMSSTFKSNADTKVDNDAKASEGAASLLFGKGFRNVLSEAHHEVRSPQSQETQLDEDDGNAKLLNDQDLSVKKNDTTPTNTSAPSRFQFPGTSPPSAGGLFGTQAQAKDTPAAVNRSTPSVPLSGKSAASTTPQDSPTKLEDPLSKPHERHSSPVVKTEQNDETDFSGVNESIPEAPLPPDPISKSSYAPGDSSASSTSAIKEAIDDAPLPPDFVPSKLLSKAINRSQENELEKQLSLPIGEDGETFDGEDSGVDVAQEISPSSELNDSFKVTPESSFGGGTSFGRNLIDGLFDKVEMKSSQQPPRSLSREISKTSIPSLSLPRRVQESSRSPSPLESSINGDSLRPENARSISAPGQATKIFSTRNGQPYKPSTSSVTTNIQSMEDKRKKEAKRLYTRQTRSLVEDDQDLTNDQDDAIRRELSGEIKGTRVLEEFVAHQDYIREIIKPGIPGQIERVYSDMSSMIDTLGRNARSLKAFTKGHAKSCDSGGRSREDLDHEANWSLEEMDDLANVAFNLTEQLESIRVHNVQEKLNTCQDYEFDLAKLHSKKSEVKKFTNAHSDPAVRESARTALLSAEQASLQHDLRKSLTSILKLLAETEERISMLKAKLVSQSSYSNSKGGAQHKVPTIEAITNTIMKMTIMVEKKGKDIDILESQMQNLRFSPLQNHSGSIESSALATPERNARSNAYEGPGSGSPYAPFYTPNSSNSRLKASFTSTAGGKKRMASVTEEDIQRYKVKMERRKRVKEHLRETLVKTGLRVSGFEDE